MRKKSQDELGTLVTREMKVMLQDESLTKEQRFDILSCVMFDAPLKNTLMASFANSLKAGFDKINATKIKAVMAHREAAKLFAAQARASKKKLQRLLDAGYIDVEGEIIDINNKELLTIDINGNQLSTTSRQRQRQSNNISPYKPPKGGGKLPKVVRPEDLLKDGPKKGGRCRHTDANGYCTNVKMQGGGFKCTGPGCDGREEVDEDSPQALAGRTFMCAQLAYDLSQTEAFGHMRASDRSLRRCLILLAGKNSARLNDWRNEVMAGLAAWTEKWKADDWQYAPGKITKWLVDEKYLQPPRKKTAPAEGSGCGDCGAEIA